MTAISELVINFHMTEACNYRCGFCYATWEGHVLASELHRSPGQTERFISALADYFLAANPLQAATGYTGVRLNFAGGEPLLLGDRFFRAVDLAARAGFRASLITNGHFLDRDTLAYLSPRLAILGVSCDGTDADQQHAIGRVDRHGRRLDAGDLYRIFDEARFFNPGLERKLNTVVNAFNWRSDMNSLVARLAPDKWKVLRVLPVYSSEMAVSKEEFQAFLDRHAGQKGCLSPEDNHSMAMSYLMLNPEGRFYQNRPSGAGYVMSRPLLDVGVGPALAEVQFDTEAFGCRYRRIPAASV